MKRVILVEDDPDDLELFYAFLSNRTDIQLVPAVTNGLELTKYLASLTNESALPDLIVLDQNMPLMNGKQTLLFLKENPRYSKITAVIYSTYADTSLIVECKKLGARIVASKPIDQDGYNKMMDDFLAVI